MIIVITIVTMTYNVICELFLGDPFKLLINGVSVCSNVELKRLQMLVNVFDISLLSMYSRG